MALQACRECGHETSTSAEQCPACGALAPTAESQKRLKDQVGTQVGLLAFGAVVVLLVGAALFFNWLADKRERDQRTKENFCYVDASVQGLNPGTDPHQDFVDRCLARVRE